MRRMIKQQEEKVVQGLINEDGTPIIKSTTNGVSIYGDTYIDGNLYFEDQVSIDGVTELYGAGEYGITIFNNDEEGASIQLSTVSGSDNITIHGEEVKISGDSGITLDDPVNFSDNVNFKNAYIVSTGNMIVNFNDDGEDKKFELVDSGEGETIVKIEELNLILPNLPTSDPEVEGAIWNDNGVLKISAGE